MPIRSLGDRGPSFPQLGNIRKGAKKTNENKPGADLSYFRFESHDAEAVQAFEKFYGKEPRAIRIFLPFPTLDENFEYWREEWSASSLKHRCDEQEMVLWLTPGGSYSTERRACPYADIEDNKKKGCKAVGRLKVIVPEFRRLAYVTVHTTSGHDLRNILDNLRALYSGRQNLTGVPLIMRRVEKEISTPRENGQRVRAKKWLIEIEAAPQWVDLQLASQEQAALVAPPQLALPEWEGDDDDSDEIEETIDPVEEQMREIFAEQGKTPQEWQTYRTKFLAGKSDDEKQQLLTKLQAAAAKKKKVPTPPAAEVQGEVVNPDLDAVEALLTELRALPLGPSPGEIDAQIARMANGQVALDEMDARTLKDVREGLEYWRDKLTGKLKKAS